MKQLLVGFALGLAGSTLGAFIAHRLTISRERRYKFNDAAAKFNGSFLNELRLLKRFPSADGSNRASHILQIETLNKHEIAAMRFRQHLNRFEKIGFDKAWKEYAGCDNESNDPQPGEYEPFTENTLNGQNMMKKAIRRIETLLTFAKFK